MYGGQGIKLEISEDKVRIELDCSHGEFPRPNLDATNSFQAKGWLLSELNTFPDQEPVPAEFFGNLAASGELSV